MKKIILLLVFVSLQISAFCQVTIDEARKIYTESMDNKTTCEAAYAKFASVKNSGNPLLTGYKGAVSVAMSKHGKAAKEKLAYFNEGKKLIESSILEDNKNVELRFIRFTIQTNVPPALKYNKEIANDKKYIIDNLASVKNSGVRSRIKEYMLQYKDITTEEKQKINDL